MNKKMSEREMQIIYEYCVRVYNKELSQNAASKELLSKTHSSKASLIMYFYVYSGMRKGTYYKMGASVPFTRFLITKIFQDNGPEALVPALTAVKQHSEFRISCGRKEPSIERLCRDIIREYDLSIKYEDLESFTEKKQTLDGQISIIDHPEPSIVPDSQNTTANLDDELSISISLGNISFETKGPAKTIIPQLTAFSNDVLPRITTMLEKAYTSGSPSAAQLSPNQESNVAPPIKTTTKSPSKSSSRATKSRKTASKGRKKQPTRKASSSTTKSKQSIGQSLLNKYPDVSSLSSKMDFEAKMIPVLYLADSAGLKSSFSISEIQSLMLDVYAEPVTKKQIENVLTKRSSWFAMVSQTPRKYQLLDPAKEYAEYILDD